MAPKSRPRNGASFGGGKGKAARRQAVRPRSGAGVPLLPIVVASILAVLAIAMVAMIVYLNRPGPAPQAVSGIPCDQLEHSQVHYHAALQIVYKGIVTDLRDNTGVQTDSAGNQTCLYWLHVHAQDKNIIHVEAPANQTFTLGQFVDVANAWSNSNGYGSFKLDSTHVATFTLGPTDKVVIYVDLGDGKGPTVYTGDPRAIVLKSHEVITIAIDPPDGFKPPAFNFPAGL